ncbi:MAG: acyl-CoA carboxylase subunit beta [Anaerolineaceae bacterium]|nr:acyl-CoA carboxylase subunit beta [Anaerolineaceae bacterium]
MVEQYEYYRMESAAIKGGGEEQITRQHAKGKNTARERIEALLDQGTFTEIDRFVSPRPNGAGADAGPVLTDGVITGWGKIDGRQVFLFAQDFTVWGGSVGEAHGKKIAKIIDLATQSGAAIIGLNDSGGARIQEGVDSLAAYGEIFSRNTRASGVIPQLSVILGPCAGGAVYSPAITDFIFMVEEIAYMFITGPDVVKSVTHEEVGFDSLGGASVHRARSGVAHFTAPDEASVFGQVRRLLSFLPSNNLSQPPYLPPADGPRWTPELETAIPADPQKPYDIHQVIGILCDDHDFLEVQPDYAQNLVVGFARLNGYPIGIVANQPDFLAGVLDINASDKGARFIRFCDAFHLPLVTLVDTPGFLPGVEQEHGGIIRHGAKMIYAYAEASVPKLALILRKAYGGAYIVMSSKHLGGDMNLALPTAEIAVMGPEGAVQILHRKEIAAAEDPATTGQELTHRYRELLANPYVAASRGYVDDVILAKGARMRIINALENLQNKRQPGLERKHGNIPL